MPYIKLTRDKETLVDEEDYAWLSTWNWCFQGNYAARRRNREKGSLAMMHQELAWRWYGQIPEGYMIDHADRNKLNNTKANIRIVDKSGNNANREVKSKSGYKGVHWSMSNKKWVAEITRKGKHYILGYFVDPQEAHEAYKKAFRELYEMPYLT